MAQIQSVLAATDFSSAAHHAVERAAMLGKTLSMPKGVVLHVLEESWVNSLKRFAGMATNVEEKIFEETLRSLGQLIFDIRKKQHFHLEPEVRTGNTLNTIIDALSGFDLLVLGAHGQHPVRALALGTTSQRLLSKVRKPVLVVKQKPGAIYQRVFVAVDFSPNSVKALEYSKIIAPEALICVVHVFEPLFERKMIYAGASDESIEQHRVMAQIEAEMEMTGFIKDVGIPSEHLIRRIEYGHPPDRLNVVAEEMNPDLVIVGKHGRSRIEELLLGSTTLHLLSESKCDVLVVG